jgi:hypothetical protein
MKKTQKTIISIFSLIIFTFFAGTSWADVCTGSYDVNNIGDIATISSCTEITGYLSLQSTTLTDLTGLENLTSVGWSLYIQNTALPDRGWLHQGSYRQHRSLYHCHYRKKPARNHHCHRYKPCQ